MIEASYRPPEEPSGFLIALGAIQLAHFILYLAASERKLRPAPALPAAWIRRLLFAFALSFTLWFAHGIAVGRLFLAASVREGDVHG